MPMPVTSLIRTLPRWQDDLSRVRERALIGIPETIRRRLAAYEQVGAQEIILYMPDAATLESVRLFARACMGT